MTSHKPIRLVVVDDEPLARSKVRELVKDDPELRIVAECVNGLEAIPVIENERPDLLLLDVQMPEMGGFEVLEAMEPENLPLVIFVTAYDHYAVKAFEVNALDYLLKPFDRERFNTALARAKVQIRNRENGQIDGRLRELLRELRSEKRCLERLVIKRGGRVFFLSVEEIDWIEAQGNYVAVHAGKKSHLIRETIGSLSEQLDSNKFVRIHRSSIVNLERIRELQPWSHGEYHVILHDGTQLTLSRSYRENFQIALGRTI